MFETRRRLIGNEFGFEMWLFNDRAATGSGAIEFGNDPLQFVIEAGHESDLSGGRFTLHGSHEPRVNVFRNGAGLHALVD